VTGNIRKGEGFLLHNVTAKLLAEIQQFRRKKIVFTDF
jgi:hypothetical protein